MNKAEAKAKAFGIIDKVNRELDKDAGGNSPLANRIQDAVALLPVMKIVQKRGR